MRGNKRPFDVAFCDTCIGGSTVAVNLALPGLRAFYLADYTVNPLGTRDEAGVHAALERWVDIAAQQAPVIVVACNTASVRLEDAHLIRERADELGCTVYSMLDLLEAMLQQSDLGELRVCLMGTEFTVGQPAYVERLERAGAAAVTRLGATQTERTIAHLQHETRAGRDAIRTEIADGIRASDAVVLACTCFPLIADLIEETNPGIRLLDPGREVRKLLDWPARGGPNHLTLALAGDSIAPKAVQAQALFPGWDGVELVSHCD